MNMAMSWTQVVLNIIMAIVGGFGGFLLGRWTAQVAREEQAATDTGTMRIHRKRGRVRSATGAVVVIVVLALMVAGALTQSGYDKRLQCNSNYIDAFQETLRANAAATTRSNQTQLDNVQAQRAFLDAVGNGEQDAAAFRDYQGALNNYENSLRTAIASRQPYPENPNCEEQ